jgi:hypothetical protein
VVYKICWKPGQTLFHLADADGKRVRYLPSEIVMGSGIRRYIGGQTNSKGEFFIPLKGMSTLEVMIKKLEQYEQKEATTNEQQ